MWHSICFCNCTALGSEPDVFGVSNSCCDDSQYAFPVHDDVCTDLYVHDNVHNNDDNDYAAVHVANLSISGCEDMSLESNLLLFNEQNVNDNDKCWWG